MHYSLFKRTIEAKRNGIPLLYSQEKKQDLPCGSGKLTAGIRVTITIVLYFRVELQVLFDNNIGAVSIDLLVLDLLVLGLLVLGLLVLSLYVFHLIS